MTKRPADPQPPAGGTDIGDRAFGVVGLSALALLVLAMLAAAFGVGSPRSIGGASASVASTRPGSSSAPADAASFLYATPRRAAPIELVDAAERPFSLAASQGSPVLVFFGYTHCPDVCPATVGIVGRVLADVGGGSRAVFVTVDPERDTPTWLEEYDRYLPPGFTTLTGAPDRIRATADAWGVRYAKVASDRPDTYSMSHTADVYLIDAAGRLRGAFPFGTTAEQMEGAIRAMIATATPSPVGSGAIPPAAAVASPSQAATTPRPTEAPTYGLRPTVVSSSVWAGGGSPVILAIDGPAGRLDDPTIAVTAQLIGSDGTAIGPAVGASAVRPPSEDRVLYVPTLDIPTPGSWRLEVTAVLGSAPLHGTVDLVALDPGSTTPIGGRSPSARTPTLTDVGGDHWAVSTDPAPEPRLYAHSTGDALAEGTPFVLVVDSVRFRVSPACGKAVVMARYFLDRWPHDRFIHLEPFRYAVVTETPVIEGSLADPQLTDAAAAWGLAGSPWGARSVPWVFIVDGHGIVRAKYEGVIGTDDVDVILSLIAQGG